MTKIINEINKHTDEKINSSVDLFSLPMTAQFRLIQFSGRADNSDLVGNFNPIDLQGRSIVIKGIKIVPYYENISQDFYLSDGVTVNQELLPANCRINRIFDVYDYGCQLTLLINGSPVALFPSEVLIVPPAGDGNIPLDLDIDNLFYRYPAKLVSLAMRLDARIFQTLNVPVEVAPVVKIFLQCYLI